MKKICFFVSLILISYVGICFAQETVSITTYYPAPYGVYRNLTFVPINPALSANHAPEDVCTTQEEGIL